MLALSLNVKIHSLSVKHFSLTHRQEPIRCYHFSNGNEGVLHIPPKLQHYWSLIVILFHVIYRILIGGSLILLGCIIYYWTPYINYIYKHICIFFIIKSFRIIIFIFIVIIIIRPSSGVCRTLEPSRKFELRPLVNPVLILLAITGYKLSIPVSLLACSQDWTCNLQMIVSLEA